MVERDSPTDRLIARSPDQLVLIACPEAYALMISNDLVTLDDRHLERVRLFGPRNPESLSKRMRRILMPYNENFDGSESPLPGTRVDFPQRTCRHFVERVMPNMPFPNCLAQHRSTVLQLMSELPPPTPVKRQTMSDEQIVQLITQCWDEANGHSSKMLRVLRDHKNVACEQSRFAALFKVARERVIA